MLKARELYRKLKKGNYVASKVMQIYSKLLNHPERLEAIKEHNQLCDAVAEVTAEQQMSKEAKKQKKERTVAVKKKKKYKEDTIESSKKN